MHFIKQNNESINSNNIIFTSSLEKKNPAQGRIFYILLFFDINFV